MHGLLKNQDWPLNLSGLVLLVPPALPYNYLKTVNAHIWRQHDNISTILCVVRIIMVHVTDWAITCFSKPPFRITEEVIWFTPCNILSLSFLEVLTRDCLFELWMTVCQIMFFIWGLEIHYVSCVLCLFRLGKNICRNDPQQIVVLLLNHIHPAIFQTAYAL